MKNEALERRASQVALVLVLAILVAVVVVMMTR